jgi:hypothetical protein
MVHIALALVLVPAGTAPTLTNPSTLGGTAGTSSRVTLSGTNLKALSDVWLGPRRIACHKIESKPESATVTLALPADLAVGVHVLHAVTADGISNPRPFSVDDLTEVAASSDRTRKDTAMAVAGPCVIAGATTADASDFYKLHVRAGERWAFEVAGRRLGSPIDPVIILHEAKSNRELPGLYADDTPGLQTDCRVATMFQTEMDVVIEVRDTTYRGGADFGYRLRIGDFPAAIGIMPLRVDAGTKSVSFAGGAELPAFTLTTRRGLASPAIAKGPRGWGLPIVESGIRECVEAEPNDTTASAMDISVPGGVSARFEKKNDLDHFRFNLKKGDKIAVTAEAAEHNLPTEVLLKAFDAAGKEVAASLPEKLPAALEFTATADGVHVVRAEHLNYLHGPKEIYRLVVKRVGPTATVVLGSDRLRLPATLMVSAINRLNGYEGAVELEWDGDAAITGHMMVPAKGKAPVQMKLETAAGAKAGVYAGVIRVKLAGQSVGIASTIDIVKTAFPNVSNAPPEMNGVVLVQVR